MEGRLNLFQRMMLRWRELHPYNPVHIVRIPAPLERARLEAVLAQALESRGLTGLELDEERGRFRYAGGPAPVQLALLPGGGEAPAALAREIERQFNLPFERGPRPQPFRFFARAAEDGFDLGLAYDHFVAAGDAIVHLLTAIARAYLGDAGATAPAALNAYPATYRTVFLRHPLWVAAALAALPSFVASARRACRPRYDDPDDARNAFKYFRLGPDETRALVGAGKAWGVSVNDLVMASLLRAVAPLAPGRAAGVRRDQVAVASIVNIRRDLPAAAGDALSPFLAAFRVGHRVPNGIGLRELVADVHRDTARIKRRHLYLQGILALGVSALMWRSLTLAQRHRFYAKHYPAWAGVTMLNVNELWRQTGVDAARLDYLRAVPTGPLCPMVFALTAVRDVLHVGVSFRTGAFSQAAVDRVADAFARSIATLDPEAAV